MRGLADNTIDEADEPEASDRTEISFDVFYNIVRKAFGHASKAHAGASAVLASLVSESGASLTSSGCGHSECAAVA
eukprot:13607895-Alexandrium_andersonii.AAC.1